MKRSSRSNRFGLGRGLRSLLGKRKNPLKVAQAAGSAFETLESRQMLDAADIGPLDITITQVNPFTGLGTANAVFEYLIPVINTVAPSVVQDTIQNENFDMNFPGAPPAPVPSGTVWPQSHLRVDHNLTATLRNFGIAGAIDNRLQVNIGPGQFISLGDVQDQANPNTRVGIRSMAFDVFGQFNTDDLTADILGVDGAVLASFTGPALAALAIGNRYQFNAPGNSIAFAQVRLTSHGSASAVFQIDNVTMVEHADAFAAAIGIRVFAARIAFSGPLGANVRILDLYGRPIRYDPDAFPLAYHIGPLANGNSVASDFNGDGIAEFNDGIGQVLLSGTNAQSTFTMFGGTVQQGSGLDDPVTMTPDPKGIYDQFEAAGMGFNRTGTPPVPTGLPPGSGSTILGSPFVRNNTSTGAYYAGIPTPVTGNFVRSDQGIFLTDGSNLGSAYVHGLVFGSSQFNGSVDRLIMGTALGSFSVQGDLTTFVSSSDAGMWVDDDGAPTVRTGGQLNVGRTIGEVDIGGRSQMNVTVLGDLSRPALHRPGDIFRFFEKEWSPNSGLTPQPVSTIFGILGNSEFYGGSDIFAGLGIFFGRASQQIAFADSYMSNDTIMGAEWIGNAGSAVQVNGDLGANDPVQRRQDPSDVYAFAADGTQDITVELSGTLVQLGLGTYARIVDQDGRTLSSFQFADASSNTRRFTTMHYRPNSPGVYYLVVQSQAAGANVLDLNYVVTVSGMAPSTLGALRTAGGLGGPLTGPAINVLSGSVGSVRIGTDYVDGAGADADPAVVYNISTGQGDNNDSSMALRSATFSIPGNLYNLTTGGDVEGGPTFFTVGGNIGRIVTGLSPVMGLGPNNGDFRGINMSIGGSVGMFDIRGALGIDQDPMVFPKPWDGPNTIVIRTGVDPLKLGDIGMFRVGWNAGAGTLQLRTPNHSVVGGFLVAQDIADDGSIYNGIYGTNVTNTGEDLQLGFNSDIRFFDTDRIWQHSVPGVFTPLVVNTPVVFTDDAGQSFQITVEGPDGNAGGLVRSMPIGGSLGVAVGRIEVNLIGGATLRITTLGQNPNAPVISIGRIVITNSDANSSIDINGMVSVDVWRIEQTGGAAFNTISNSTPNGDLVAVDVIGLNGLTIGTGDLGRTQVPAWGPQRIGPFIGITRGGAGGVSAEIGIPGAVMSRWWNGNLFRPVNNSGAGQPPTSWLDDIGSPVDPYLDGLIVRTGDIQVVQVGGAVGDVIAAAGNILQVTANADMIVAQGHFDGIIGTIYANRIAAVDVGSGLAQRDDAPLSTTGIFANDDIGMISSTTPGAFISSVINAANQVPLNADNTFLIDGVSSVDLHTGGSYVDAFIGSMSLDDFWDGFYPDDGVFAGTIDHIGGMGANLLRSQVRATVINTISLMNGFYDASETESATDIGTIEARGFRNSTTQGGDLEYHINSILVGANLGTLQTLMIIGGPTPGTTLGDINDLLVDVLGRTTEIKAQNIRRSSFDSDVSIDHITVMGNMGGSSITAGRLGMGDFQHNIASSIISISGPLEMLMIGDAALNVSVNITGPDGRLDMLTARTGYTGSITSAGPIDTIEVTEGDLNARITTYANQHGGAGNIHMLSASRDLILRTDIGGTVDEFHAGRHIGSRANPTVILVHGSVLMVDAANGQIYSDLRVGQNITTVLIGPVVNRPGDEQVSAGSIIASGRIENVNIVGDFGGTIASYSGGIGVIAITNGSLLPQASISALDGQLNNIFITNGHLFGSVHADYSILAIRLDGGADGVFGDIGINPALSSGTFYDAFRNQLPPNVIANASIQGPRITAGYNIGRIILTNGSIFEAHIQAGRAIGTIDVTGNIMPDSLTPGQSTLIAAGSTIFLVHATGNVVATDILAGIKSFGDDGRAGGQGANADTVRSGRITTVQVDGGATGLHVSAGMDPGADGQYNTFDELVAPGISFVRSVTVAGALSDVSVFADSPTLTVSPGIVRAGTTFPNMDPDLSTGAAVPGGHITAGTPFNFSWGGVTGTILFTGPGNAYWDSAAGRVSLVNTRLNSSVAITATGTLNNFSVVTNDDASVDTISVSAPLAGHSVIDVDAYALSIALGNFSGTGFIKAGMNLRSLAIGTFTGGFIQGAYWVRDIVFGGNYGNAAVFGESRIDLLAGATITIAGSDAGLINVERDLSMLTVGAAMNRAQTRVGNSLGGLDAGSVSQSRISVGDNLGPVDIAGDVTDTSIMAGGDLGEDAAPGGTGFNADAATGGSIASVHVGGNFLTSDIVAGMLRGPDGFFGTFDDQVAPGRTFVGAVTIDGTLVGSNNFTEQYRVSATGGVGPVLIGGAPATNTGNFRVKTLATDPTPIRVVDLQVFSVSGQWQAVFFFNQAMDLSSFGPALSIAEVRDSGMTTLPLVQGTDYTIGAYDPAQNSITVVFSRTVTDRNLIPTGGTPLPGASTPGTQDPNLPGPGVFRFDLSSAILRAQVANARLDGDSNGFASSNEDYSQDEVVGDAGDKFTPEVDNVGTGTPDQIVDLYGPADLDLVLDNNLTPDGLPDPNKVITLRGTIGDHPDNDVNNFRLGGDTDIYKITLQAGQILRMGAMAGSALFAGRFLYDGNFVQQGGSTDNSLQLPVGFGLTDLTAGDDYLIRQTGTFYIVVSNASGFDVPGVPNIEPGSGNTGDYRFTLEVFDDGDSGFAAGNNAGNGTPVVNAPAPIVFAGPNGVFQNPGDPNYDDLTRVTVGDYVFTLSAGTDGIRGTADDVVTGDNGAGITSVQAGGMLTSTINSSIGPAGHVGVPGDVTSDVDVFNLNNGQTISPGTLITIKVKLADLGADLGNISRATLADFRGDVQFAVFDTTDSTGVNDARLVFSPTDFLPRAGEPGTAPIARSGNMQYGFDANGDFYITFIAPDHIGGTTGQPAKFAVMLQGAFNTDYTIEVSQSATPTNLVIPQARQNVFLELNGGTIDWLQPGGIVTKLLPFDPGVLGFTGVVGGMPVGQYISTRVVSTLQSIFTASGLDIVVSSDPSAFEFQDYSTVIVSGSNDPTTIFNRGSFGYSEHSDPFNLDRNDKAVVFMPSFAPLGYTPSQADVDAFVLSLSAAIGRRAGELMGLRITEDSSPADAPIDLMSANSVANIPGSGNAYALSTIDRNLSPDRDEEITTNFFIGQQNAFSLLDKFLTP